MALYIYYCPACNSERNILNKPSGYFSCLNCNTQMVRKPEGPSSQVMEKLDNGRMPRAIERLADAEELSKERAKKGPS